ncbi:hypothetical protein HY489_00645 [Candidatus Woesearchaeota archaeon]|nr:hypothetical protein [Candidatus Woesearchaeota archaeon]
MKRALETLLTATLLAGCSTPRPYFRAGKPQDTPIRVIESRPEPRPEPRVNPPTRTPEIEQLEQELNRLPRHPNPQELGREETILQYEARLPGLPDTPARPDTTDIEHNIKNQYGVVVRGEKTRGTLLAIEQALSKMPAVNPCPVYLVPDQFLLGQRHCVAGWYQEQPTPHIIIFTGDLPSLDAHITHEFTHHDEHILGTAFSNEFAALNRHLYGVRRTTANGRAQWEDGTERGARYGCVGPYAIKDVHEDIAETLEVVRHGRLGEAVREADNETKRILTTKVNCLERYRRITPAEAIQAREILRTPVENTITPPEIIPAQHGLIAEIAGYLGMLTILTCALYVANRARARGTQRARPT